jgi:hypothetical protein
VIVRVLEGRLGTRIQVVVLGRDEVHEFSSWAMALQFVRQVSARSGLR